MLGLNKKTWIIGGTVAALVGTSAFASGWRDKSPEQRAEMRVERVAERLELNDAQKEAFRKVVDTSSQFHGARPEMMAMLTGQLKELSADGSLTIDEANLLRDQIKSEFDKRANAVIPEFVTFYNSLDNKQRDMVMTRLEKMGEHMEKGRGHRKGWGKKGENHRSE